jgi:protein-disulfide isomerase
MKIRGIVLLLLFLTTAFGQSPAKSGRSLGVAVAPIIIEVFSDFQCPHCKLLYEKTLRPLVEDYVRTGKVYLVHRFYPLAWHAYAKQAACYACAADHVGKYEQTCEVLFRKQDDWAKTGEVDETVCGVLTPAEAAKVRVLAKDPAVLAEVMRDVELGQRAKIQGTPTMLITHNGQTQPIANAVSYSLLRRYLDDLLKR